MRSVARRGGILLLWGAALLSNGGCHWALPYGGDVVVEGGVVEGGVVDARGDVLHAGCFFDDFNAGGFFQWNAPLGAGVTGVVAGGNWQVVMPAKGPDGTPALEYVGTGIGLTSHSSLQGLTGLALELDFRVEGISGDLFLLVAPAGSGFAGPAYAAGIHPVGGDSPVDQIVYWDGSTSSKLDEAAPPLTIASKRWHRARLTVSAAGAIAIEVDGEARLAAEDLRITPPYDVAVGFGNRGLIDNVSLCPAR